MKPFAVYSVLKYLQQTVKFFSTWSVNDQIFSQCLKITFNNVVKKFAKICKKKSQSFLQKCMREKLLIYVSAIQILINAENI